MTSLILWAYTIGAAAMFILCDSLAANWGKTKDLKSLIIVFLLGPIAYVVFGLLNQTKSLAISSGMVNILLIAGNVLVGVLIFREILSPREWLGLGFGVVALILMSSK